MIRYTLQRGDTVIASTAGGLFRASLTDKIWHKMVTPADMPPNGCLAQQDEKSPRLAYYTGDDVGFPMMLTGEKGSLFLSHDDGKTWSPTALRANVTDVFLHPDGAIYAATWTDTSASPGKSSFSWTENGAPHSITVHLVVSRDDGKTWRDITPPVRQGWGLWGIFRDPDHPDLVCVKSGDIGHISRTLIYQATDITYAWMESFGEKWHDGLELGLGDWWPVPMSNSDMPATLATFLKFPFPPTGPYPSLPTKMLVTDKTSYRFHPPDYKGITVTTWFLVPDPPIKVIDMKDATAFWSIRVKPPDGKTVFVGGRSSELNIGYPDLDARRARYANDPYLLTQQVDQDHPYQRLIDLEKLFAFKKPGKYRVQLTYSDQAFDRDAGTMFGTAAFEVEILP